MELHIIYIPEDDESTSSKSGRKRSNNPKYYTIVLLDENMRIVKPVYEYLKKLKFDGMKLNTLIANGRDLKIYWEFLHHYYYNYDEITPLQINEFREFLQKENPYDDTAVIYKESKRTGKTINRILSTVYNFYKYWGAMSDVNNPILMKEIRGGFNTFKGMLEHARRTNTTVKSIFKVKEQEQSFKLLTEEEIEKVFGAFDTTRDRLIWLILASTGARIGEVLELKFDNVPYPDPSEGMGILKNVKSKGKFRDILIPTYVLIELDNYIMEERNNIDVVHDYIFVALSKKDFGNPLTYSPMYQKITAIKKNLGLEFNFHDLRHTFTTNLIEAGYDIAVVKEIIGHKHVTTTQKYTHVSNTHLQERLAKYWEKKRILGGMSDEKELS